MRCGLERAVCGAMPTAVRRCSRMSQSSARSWKEVSPKVSSTQSIWRPCALTEARKRRKLSTLFWWRPGLKKVEMPMNLPGGRFEASKLVGRPPPRGA